MDIQCSFSHFCGYSPVAQWMVRAEDEPQDVTIVAVYYSGVSQMIRNPLPTAISIITSNVEDSFQSNVM